MGATVGSRSKSGLRRSLAVAVIVVFDELFEVGSRFGGEDHGFGVDARFEGVTAVGFYLTLGGQNWLPDIGTDRDVCPTITIRGWIRGFRGEYL